MAIQLCTGSHRLLVPGNDVRARRGMGNGATAQARRFRLLVLANYVGWGHNMDSLFWELYQAIVHHRAFMIDSR